MHLPKAIKIIILTVFLVFSPYIYSDSKISGDIRASTLSSNNSPGLVVIGGAYAMKWNLEPIGCMEVTNKGVFGELIHATRQRYQSDALPNNTRVVLVWGYINDLQRSPREQISQVRERIIEDVKEIINISSQRGVVPVLVTDATMGVSKSMKWKVMSWVDKLRGRQSYQDYVNSNVIELNNWIKEFGRSNNILVLDVGGILADKDGNRKDGFAYDDGSHITDSGYQAINKYAMPILEQYFINELKVCL